MVNQLYQFVICTSSQGGNKGRQVMSKFVQFTAVHFPDLNPNSYDNVSNMKLDLNLHQGANANLMQMTRAFSLKIRVITGFF